MSVHDISEAKAAARISDTPRRHDKWRNDWQRFFYAPSYDSDGKRWDVTSHLKLALHYPTRAAFHLEYDARDLLHRIGFLPQMSQAPATTWERNGPEMSELVAQIAEIYRHWG